MLPIFSPIFFNSNLRVFVWWELTQVLRMGWRIGTENLYSFTVFKESLLTVSSHFHTISTVICPRCHLVIDVIYFQCFHSKCGRIHIQCISGAYLPKLLYQFIKTVFAAHSKNLHIKAFGIFVWKTKQFKGWKFYAEHCNKICRYVRSLIHVFIFSFFFRLFSHNQQNAQQYPFEVVSVDVKVIHFFDNFAVSVISMFVLYSFLHVILRWLRRQYCMQWTVSCVGLCSCV